jgi:hypothetical protein
MVLHPRLRSHGRVLLINRTGPYEYLSYDFANRSPDIAGLFVAACHQVGVSSSPTWDSRRRIWRVRINQRASVAQMEAHIGLKR